jgi:tetratricopeptide (TPR) repeat protein
MPGRVLPILTLLVLTAVGVTTPRQTAQDRGEDAYRANNIGVALLEQYQYDEAATSFRQALKLEPGLHTAQLNLAIALFYAGQLDEALSAATAAADLLSTLPHPRYVIGLVARAQGRPDEAATAFKRVLQLDASDVGSRVNLGQLHVQQRQYAEAATLFREALKAEPFNVTAAYGLATTLSRSGDPAAAAAMKVFESLREAPYGVTYSQTYLQQGRYAEALASTGAEPELVDAAPPQVSFTDSTAEVFPSQQAAASNARAGGGRVALADIDGDGDLDAFAASGSAQSQRLYLNDARRFTDATERAGLSVRDGPAAHAAVAADVDNDGRPDLLLLRPGGARLLRQREGGAFEDITDSAGLRSTPDLAASAAFVDVDHDGDLDIFIAGGARATDGGARPAANQLFRNNGTGTFADITRDAGLLDGEMRGIAIAPIDFDDRRDIDLLVLGPSRPPRLFKNMRDGSFHDAAADAGLSTVASYSALAAADVDKNGHTDFLFGRSDAAGTLVTNNGHGRFEQASGPDVPAGITVAQFVDYDNDGLLDLVTAARRSVQLSRNLGRRWADTSEAAGFSRLAASLSSDIESIAFGDLDRDGDPDALVLLANGELRCWRNQGGSAHKSVQVGLVGRVSNRGGIGSKVELRAGSLRQRVEMTAVTPALGQPDVVFGLGPRQGADVVRVLWPSGTLQAETITGSGPVVVTELDRKPSSCPYLYVWNGSRFEFVTDFMGGGEVGYWMGPGVWNTPDPDEYVRIAPGRLQPRGGTYDIRVTNELEEALFVDHLQLVAIDHDVEVDVFPNEGLGAPGSGRFPPTTVRGARPPMAATDGRGRDLLPLLRVLDRHYVDGFALLDIRGYAEPHDLYFDIGPGSTDVVLLATGWTDYAFSGDNVAAHQRDLALRPPVLEVRTATGEWRQIESMGIPVGRPQTLTVHLEGRLRPGERQLRIRTNMRIYWDQILVDRSGGNLPIRVTRLDPVDADLRWRGFSAEISPDRAQPFTYDYDTVSLASPWKTMIGRYTREGDVRELLKRVDDMFVIARPGDEIALAFDARSLPPLAAGQTRTFLLFADGFSKEMDIRSATPHTVEPLPFHGMRSYPYGADERYPATAAHLDYRTRYNTRVVSRSAPPLEISVPDLPRSPR